MAGERRHISGLLYLDLLVTNLVFGITDKARHKPVSSATETSQKIEILPITNGDMIDTFRKANN